MDLKKGLSSGYCCLVLQDVDREDAAPSASVRMQVPTCVKHCETLYFTVFEDVFEGVFSAFHIVSGRRAGLSRGVGLRLEDRGPEAVRFEEGTLEPLRTAKRYDPSTL